MTASSRPKMCRHSHRAQGNHHGQPEIEQNGEARGAESRKEKGGRVSRTVGVVAALGVAGRPRGGCGRRGGGGRRHAATRIRPHASPTHGVRRSANPRARWYLNRRRGSNQLLVSVAVRQVRAGRAGARAERTRLTGSSFSPEHPPPTPRDTAQVFLQAHETRHEIRDQRGPTR